MLDVASNQQLLEPKQGGDITYRDMVDEREAMGQSEIQKFYSGSTVFITGGTGFLGKLFVEKLLRSCPDVKKVYLLARPKKDKDPKKRLEEQFDDVLYDKLRKILPDFLQKIAIIEGDIGEIDLGIKEDDKKTILNEVEIIIHGAATVRFDEAMKKAVEINVRGTREIFLLARACAKLKSIVHISTAYCNCLQRTIEEKFYECPVSGEKLIDLVETLDEKVINNIASGLLGDYPNTYAFTKLAAENIVEKYAKGLPAAVFRPAIVIATAREPIAGWIDNVYGPTGVVVAAAIGILRTLNCNPDAIADLVPGDFVVNACLSAAWKASRDYSGNHEDAPPLDVPPPIYNYVSSEQLPLTWKKFMHYVEIYGLTVPSMHAVWYYLLILTPNRFLYNTLFFLLHWVPAYIVDGVASLIGKKPMLRKAYTKVSKFADVIAYFACDEWKFDNKNVVKLYEELCPADKHIFDFDITGIDWSEYFLSYTKGVRVYLIKDPIDTVPAAYKKFFRLKVLHYTTILVISLLLLRLFWSIFSSILGF